MNLDLSGKHALVCGASAGIGRAAAMSLAEIGASVTVLARSAPALEGVVGQLRRRKNARHHYVQADAADHAHLAEVVADVVRERPVHILVNNTGGPPSGAANTAAVEEFLDAFNKHLIANHVLVQGVIPGMKNALFGRIINVISTSVKEPIKNLGVSNTVRGAVASWAKTLATELGPYGITVNNVLPGYTRTARLEQILADRVEATGKSAVEIEQGMIATVPLARFAEPNEIGDVIAFLASGAASYVSGINLPVDGGRTQSL